MARDEGDASFIWRWHLAERRHRDALPVLRRRAYVAICHESNLDTCHRAEEIRWLVRGQIAILSPSLG